MNDIANFTITSHSKPQLFIKNYLLLLYITLFLVYFYSLVAIRSQSLKVLKSYGKQSRNVNLKAHTTTLKLSTF